MASATKGMGLNRWFATSTATKMKSLALNPGNMVHGSKLGRRGGIVPVCMALGMILTSTSLGLYTAMEQLLYSPNVYVSKKMREAMPEVTDPDYVTTEAEKFVRTSFFRRLARIQDGKEQVARF